MKHQLLVAAAVALAAVPAGAKPAELNTLSDVKIVPTPSGAQVVVSGTRAPTFTVFRLPDPDRLVIDLSSADATAIKGHHEGQGPIAGVVASQFSDERASVARLLVALEKASQYDVRADGARVVISVDGATAEPVKVAAAPAEAPKDPPAPQAELAQKPEPAPAAPEAKAEAAQKPELAPAPVAAAAKAPAEVPRAEEKAPRQENVVSAEVDQREVKDPAHQITSVQLAKGGLQVRTDGEVARYELLELTDPPRLALDVYGVSLSAKAPRSRSPFVKDLRMGAHDGKVRVVLDVEGEMPKYRIARQRNGLTLALSRPDGHAAPSGEPEVEIDGQKVALSEAAPVAVRPEPAEVPPPAPQAAPSALAEVQALTFDDSPAGGKVELKLSSAAKYSVERPDGASAVLTLERAHLPKRLERSLDTSALQTPVKMVSAFAVPGAADRVRVVVSADGQLDESVSRTPAGLAWRLSVKPARGAEAVAVAPKTAGFTTEARSYAEEGTPRQARYSGKRVSFEFKDIDVHNLLRVIAEISKKNIVVSDDVQGKVTIRLRNVPWDQALDLILRSKGLGMERLGNNIIRVAPLKALEEENKLRADRKLAAQKQEDLVVQLIPVNYASATDMASRVKDVLTPRGTVTVDTRTNVLIVKEIASNIGRARALVQTLDTQTPQVLIESRIIEANTNYTRDIGVQWGALGEMSPAMGNPTGLVFPNVISVRGATEQSNTGGVSDTPAWAVNLPAGVGQGSGGAVGFHFGSIGGALQLNLRLSALENQGSVKTISAPKVATLDNNTARISQGISIPFTAVSANGINVVFIEARLALEVTPHITQDGSVLMNIRAENNQPDPSLTGANGQPSIQRKEAATQVLVKDGDTTVIGGIYVRRGATSTAGVPILSHIPILGFLFRNDSEVDERQELLIFITPRIINRQTVAQTL